MARHSIHTIQPDLDVLTGERPHYSTDPDSLIAASQVVAIEFQTIAAANDYWRAWARDAATPLDEGRPGMTAPREGEPESGRLDARSAGRSRTSVSRRAEQLR
jgi:hypothetical protein